MLSYFHRIRVHCERIMEAVKVIRQAIAEAGGKRESGILHQPFRPCRLQTHLMKHPDVALILATGGSAMVRAAYSSGTPAIGVGPGNGPAYIEKTADLPLAVKTYHGFQDIR